VADIAAINLLDRAAVWAGLHLKLPGG